MDGSTPSEAASELIRVDPPLGMLAELTHRCPLQCPYCSNPIRLLKAGDELDTQAWLSAFSQAADLGILQVHLSGGEPTIRQDLEELVKALSSRGVYTNLITAGVTLTQDRIKQLAACGLDHIQLSLQSVD
ncbi:MAG: radical SAM protein, partial [Rhodomicrobium sp.]